MKIQSSNVAMTGEAIRFESYTKEESLQMWVEDSKKISDNKKQSLEDTVQLSAEGRSLQKGSLCINETQDIEFEISDKDKQKLLTIQKMIECLTGKKIRFYLPEKLHLKKPDINIQQNPSSADQQQKEGWGIIYQSREEYREYEKMSFSANANIQTSDGRSISLQLELNMSREFAYSNNISFRAGDAAKIDPLVINMDVPYAKLTDIKYTFDLDADGRTEQISFLAPGSGFIALDINSDGSINDGSELFGTRTGDGFKELAVYDGDNNGWIDENDSIYEKLLIWTKDEDGQDRLFALGQKGIGAIYLGSTQTDFSLKSSDNALNGEIRKTGIYLNENGSAGTVQHIDIAI